MRFWITDYHGRQFHEIFEDLCYCLVNDEKIVLSGYLFNFFDRKDETRITIAMILTKDMEAMIESYDKSKYEN